MTMLSDKALAVLGITLVLVWTAASVVILFLCGFAPFVAWMAGSALVRIERNLWTEAERRHPL